jgi:Cdc6-like AAA superfamily ATPase/tetratricopeptide (TPR) repeat protein
VFGRQKTHADGPAPTGRPSSYAVSDSATPDDRLGFKRFAEPLAATIAGVDRKNTPWTIGVYGEWGSGKTSFLMMVDKSLRAHQIEAVWFNAWKYSREEYLWPALMQTIQQTAKQSGPPIRRPWRRLRIWAKSVNFRAGMWDLARKLLVFAFRLMLFALLILMSISLIPIGNNPVQAAVNSAVSGVPGLRSALQFPGTRILVALGALLGAKPETLWKLLDVKVGIDLGKFNRRREYREQTALLDQFNAEFRGILDVVYSKRPLVVIIDDLDRCLPEQTLQIVETIKLFLDVPGCVFLLAVDREMIEHGISAKYRDLAGQNMLRQIGQTYFEKVVQMPFSLPPPTENHVDDFIRNLSGDEDVHRCVPILRGAPPYNPRRIKRSIQSFTMLKELAASESIGPAPVASLLAKLVIIQAQFREVYRATLDDPTLLEGLEAVYRNPVPLNEQTDVILAERARLFEERQQGLRALLCHQVGDDDTFEGVVLVEYLTLVRDVVPPAPAKSESERPATAGDSERSACFLVSHAHVDARWAGWVSQLLSQSGYTVSMSPERGSVDLGTMDNVDYVIGVVSEESTRSTSVRHEWAIALARKIKFLPMLVDGAKLPPEFADLRYIDVSGLGDRDARAALLSAIELGDRITGDIGNSAVSSNVVQSRIIGGDINIGPRNTFPGHGATANNTPMLPANLVAREDLLAQIAARLNDDAITAGPTYCAVVGMAGIGKTVLAKQYIAANASRYDVVWWIPAEDKTSVEDALKRLAATIIGADRDLTSEQTLSALTSLDRWLLVYDDAGEPGTLTTLLPTGGRGHVLITSRQKAWNAYAPSIEVAALDTSQAVELLRRFTESDDDKSLAGLANTLGGMPLALMVAAASINDAHIRPAEFLEILTKEGISGLDSPAGEPAVGIVIAAGLNRLTAMRDDRVTVVLNLLAVLAPAPVPRVLLIATLERSDPGIGRRGVDHALRLLSQYSLLDLSEDDVIVHPLVHQVLGTRLSDEDKMAARSAALRGMDNLVPANPEDPANWPAFARLLPHAIAAAEHLDSHHTHLLDIVLLSDLARYACSAGVPTTALGLIGIADTLAQELPTTDVVQLRLLQTRADALVALGDRAAARDVQEHVVTGWLASNERHEPEIARARTGLARILLLLDQPDEARVQQLKALGLQRAFDDSSTNIAAGLTNLAAILHRLGDIDDALATATEAREISRVEIRPPHPVSATTSLVRGRILAAIGRSDEAHLEIETAVRTRTELFGPDHPQTRQAQDALDAV